MSRKTGVFALILCLLSACYKESKLLVNADFQAIIEENNYTAPVIVVLENKSTGADFYKWTFDGGNPATSTDKTPSNITYKSAGTYTIVLEAWNDYEGGQKEFTFTVDSAVTVSFDVEVLINDFAPANVKITNTTQGASSYLWTFEGGEPATSTDQYPANVLFREEGEHTLSLVVNNGRESFSLSKKIILTPPIAIDFEIEPSFDDFDYEVPFFASLINKTRSGLTYEWGTTGGTITNKQAETTGISISEPGTYTITLKGENGKETKTLGKEITVRANTNLYSVKDVKFGIKSAVSTIGSFYSLKYRSIIPQNKVTGANGEDIHLVFFGINPTFEKCYFTSPVLAGNAGFYDIPNATQTYFVNTLETSNIHFLSSTFDAMVNDSPLKSVDIKSASEANTWFIANPVPRIILFETADGRKGAIKIKAFVSEQEQSYILTDMKFQKEKTQ
jgi:PKD repeat protein